MLKRWFARVQDEEIPQTPVAKATGSGAATLVAAFEVEEDAPGEGETAPEPRDKQKNFKMTETCLKAFEAVRKARGMTAADLFHDMVAETYNDLVAQGLIRPSRK